MISNPTEIFLGALKEERLLDAFKELRDNGYFDITFRSEDAVVRIKSPPEPITIPRTLSPWMILAIVELALGKSAAEKVAKGKTVDDTYGGFHLSANGLINGKVEMRIRFH